jgi:transcriptional regulator with XRE-family HTH domain
MDMKIDAALIKKLRDERAWSQEHLAAVSGLSLRTIQRVEADGNAAPETRLALAAAFAIDVAQLGAAEATSAPEAQPAATAASTGAVPGNRRHARLHYRLLRFALIGAFLVALDVGRHGAITWSKWPLLGWGLALLLRSLKEHYQQPAPERSA